MLRTRLWMGTVLVVLVVGALAVDRRPSYPLLFVLVEFLAIVSCFELLSLLPPERRPVVWLCYASVFVLLMSNWLSRLDPVLTLYLFAITVISAFLVEMASFRQPGGSLGGVGG